MSTLETIHLRLEQFRNVPAQQWFYELCYCILTPQTKARNAELAVQQLREQRFREEGFDPVSVLRAPSHYIRFHNTKSQRLQNVRSQWPNIEVVLAEHRFIENRSDSLRMKSLRDFLATTVDGIGMKESSHFLRNIGARGLAIIDRHLLDNLVRRGVFSKAPKVGTVKAYREVEEAFSKYSNILGIDSDILDLLFWSENTGYVGK
ncbi:MAG: hypothetical protein HYX66_02910 [Ignavibacteria bacterium]|nr:hypothetical protein [Ignavibacteria bacterium]